MIQPNANRPMANTDFSNLLQKMQFEVDVEKEAKKPNVIEEEEVLTPEPGASQGGVAGLNAKILSQGV